MIKFPKKLEKNVCSKKYEFINDLSNYKVSTY